MKTDPTDPLPENLDEGGTWMLDLVAAVDHLRRGIRPGITVWYALEEALCSTTDDADDAGATVDRLCVALSDGLAASDLDAATTIQSAIRRWALAMADRYNDGHHWPHPVDRRGFPPPEIDPVMEWPARQLSAADSTRTSADA